MKGIRDLYDMFKMTLVHALIARRSPYNKVEVFKILTTLYLKSMFQKDLNKEITHQIFNYRVSAFNYRTLLYLFKEVFLENVYYFETKNSTPHILDCGANIGMAVLYFKRLYPNCHITAFEPNPYAYKLLKKNILQNNIKDVQIENIGLSYTVGSIGFYLGEDKGSLAGSIMPNRRAGKNVLSIQTNRLSKYIGSEYFDLVKIDVEGAEGEVIEDLLETRTINNSDKYIIEYHHRINKDKSVVSDFLKPFEENGFEYNIKANIMKGTQLQDILIYFYKERGALATK